MLDMGLINYTDWNVLSVFRRADRDKYAYRVILYFADGTKRTKMYSGFATKKEAEDARKKTIGMLASGTYIVNDSVTVKEFLEYWLEYDIRERVQSSNTYNTYANIARKHIEPIIGNKKLTEVNQGDIHKLYKDRAAYSKYIVRLVKTVVNVSFHYASRCKLISVNPAEGISLPKTVEEKLYHSRRIDTAKTLNREQIIRLLEVSRDSPIRMQILFNVLMGLRRQEIIAVKYEDVDYVNRTLSVARQLGKQLNRSPNGTDDPRMARSELPLKTASSYRVLPIPDYVFEAIMEEREKYECNRRRRKSSFLDAGYICCSSYGKPRSKSFHWKYYKELLKEAGLPDIRWHDLRSTYCTLLLKENFNPKAVSRLMGHAKEIITTDVYGDNANMIPEEIPELLSYMDEVLPCRQGRENGEGREDEGLDIVLDLDGLLPERKP